MTRPIQTALHDVSLYVGGCIAARRGTVELEEGCNHVYIAGIVAGVRDDSLRLRLAKGVTQGQIRIVDKVPDHEGLLEEDAEAIRIAHGLDDEISRIEAEIGVCDTELELWRKNGEFMHAGSAATPADVVAYLEKLPERLREAQQRKRELSYELKRQKMLLNEHMKRHNLRRRTSWDDAPAPDKTFAPVSVSSSAEPQSAASAEFVAQRDRDARYVSVELWAERAATYDFELQYWQDGVSWEPLYEISAEDLSRPAELRMRAHLTQTTREDWHQVAIRLCTGNPSIGGSVPKLRPWYLDLRRNSYAMQPSYSMPTAGAAPMPAPKAKRGGGLLSGAMDALASAMPDDASSTGEFEPVLERAEVLDADRHERQTMVEYALPGLWDVPSGADGQIVDLEIRQVPADFHCYAFPRADAAVYLSARIEGAAEAFPLDGVASCYLEGMFTGTCPIDAAVVSAPDFELPFGRTDQIRVERKQVLRRTTTQPLRNLTKTAFGFEISVTNKRAEAVDVVVVDQIPMSRDTSIAIETGQTSGAAIDGKTGEVRWNLKLEAGERRTLKLEYEVAYPKKETIEGISGPDYRQTSTPKSPRGGFSSSGSPFCQCCGSPLPPGMVFCPRCGARV